MNTTQPQAPVRLHFIDVLRAFAILMMLQGHFIHATLLPEFRDTGYGLYAVWEFMRGLTAPVFFTSTGLVFTYLLLGDSRPALENTRWKKGIKRGFTLIALGYLLKMNVAMLVSGSLPSWVLATDVLQCIGLAILLIAGVFSVTQKHKWLFNASLLTIALVVIALDPSRMALDVSHLPVILQHYLSMEFGSTFTPFPWVAYSCLGALLGSTLRWKPSLAFGHSLPILLLVMGLCIHFFSSRGLMELFFLSDWQNFKDLAYSNALLMRGGQVMVLIGLFMWVIARLPRVPSLITTIGSETLTIYCGHYVILYGSGIGLGLVHIYGNSLSPFWAVTGAALFILFFIASMKFLPAIRSYGNAQWEDFKVAVSRSSPFRLLRRIVAR